MQCHESERTLKQQLRNSGQPDIYFQIVHFGINPDNEQTVVVDKKQVICDICMFKTHSIASLNLHQQLVHVGNPEESVALEYKCDNCEKVFLNHDAKKEHLRCTCPYRNTTRFICDFCKKSFTQKQILKKHLNLHLKSKEYRCKSCDKVYYSKSSLILHYRSHSIEPCPVCCKVLKSYSLPYHMLQHSNDSRLECPICNQVKFLSNASLKQHMKIHKKTKEPESLVCECGRKFNSVRGKQCHQANGCAAISKENFSFKCNVCGKSFGKKSNLSRHLTSHSESSYKWRCTVCYKRFNNSSNFKVHQYSHNPEKNIPCKICNKLFKNQDSLRSHYSIHEGKKFPCRKCEKTFGTLTLMKYHMKKKHEEET